MALNETNLRSLRKYKKKAILYDSTAHRTDWIREETIKLLNLKPGDTVLDVGCGTGLSFEALLNCVGPTGNVIGIDQSPEMIRIAQERIERNGWGNVIALESLTESVCLSRSIDAYLFHYTHDILQSEVAVKTLLSAASPRAVISVAGMKYFPLWTGPLNIYAFFKNYAWNGNRRGLRRPWRHLEKYAKITSWRPTQLGMGYIATAIYWRSENKHDIN
jgi:SAM-dependent methyltransferase